MGILDNIIGNVKNDLSHRASSGISSGISNTVSKTVSKSVSGEKSLQCPKCKIKITDPTLKFCTSCGTKLRPACDKCNQDYPFGTKFCPNCGHGLQ